MFAALTDALPSSSPALTDHAPEVSVIVPVYRQWRHLPRLVQALQAQDLGAERFEVIIVNNDIGSPFVQNAAAALPVGMARLVDCPDPGSYMARNLGATQARAPLLAFTDADCIPAPDWLSRLLQHTNAKSGHLIAGRIDVTLSQTPSRWEIFDHVRGIPQCLFVRHGYGATANLIMPRDIHHRLGGFDATRLSGGDAEFCRRAGRLAVQTFYADDAVVLHPARKTFAALVVKARRVKGGQITSGPWRQRALWTLRSLVPPLREMWHYARARAPWRYRVTAMQVRLLLWGVELAELGRLLLSRSAAERR